MSATASDRVWSGATRAKFRKSLGGAEVDECEVVVSRTELSLHAHADSCRVGRDLRHRADHPGAFLVEIDDGDDERHTFRERWHAVLADDRVRIDGSESARRDPFERRLAAVRTQE